MCASGIPWLPTYFRLLTIKDSTAFFSWKEGFNGGSAQTFLIQLSEEGLNDWSNESTVHEHDDYMYQGKRTYTGNITDLEPGSYNVRLVAINAIGMTEPVMLQSPIHVMKAGRPKQISRPGKMFRIQTHTSTKGSPETFYSC